MFCRCYGYNCTHLQNFTSYYSADCSQKKSHYCPGIYHQDQGKQVPYFILGISCQVAEKQEMILPLRYKKRPSNGAFFVRGFQKTTQKVLKSCPF